MLSSVKRANRRDPVTHSSVPGVLRFGVLGAARIAPNALLLPARQVPGVEVAAIAARDPARARAFATQYAIPHPHTSYDALINDPSIDAIYNPLPNSLHAEWSIKAMRAGKDVLCEKPIASNAEEARDMAAVARSTGRVLVEAFHNLYHPLVQRMKSIIDAGEIGAIRHIEGHFCTLIRRVNDIRFQWSLAGGATMDLGCYPLRLMRYLTGEVPTVTRARAFRLSPQIDRWMDADLRFPNGASGYMSCALFSTRLLRISAKVVGDAGEVRAINPVTPHRFNRLIVDGKKGKYAETIRGASTYTYQLAAFLAHVRGEKAMFTDGDDGITSMELIDEVYRKAGLKPRGT